MFELNEKVRVIPGCALIDASISFAEDMKNYYGMTATIKDKKFLFETKIFIYRLDVDERSWLWAEEWLEPATEITVNEQEFDDIFKE